MKRKSFKNKANNNRTNTASSKSVSIDPAPAAAERMGEHYVNIPYNGSKKEWQDFEDEILHQCHADPDVGEINAELLTKEYPIVNGVPTTDEEHNIIQAVLSDWD